MPRAISLVGRTFGRLKVIADAPSENRKGRSVCKCQCGNTTIVFNCNLRPDPKPHTQSCGCLYKESAARINFIHGHYSGCKPSDVMLTYREMMSRCYDPECHNYPSYGGRGITVCERWHKFQNFFEDMGARPNGLTLDRIKNNLGYFKENCRWATATQQARNMRSNRIMTVGGVTDCVAGLCDHFRVRHSVIRQRLHKGWTPEDAFFKPIKYRKQY